MVDDIAVGRNLIRTIVKRYGDVDTAEDGPTALEALREAVESGRSYDLAFLDIMMPGMDGIDLLRALRSLEAEHGAEPTRAVMTTAVSQREYVVAALEAGAVGYLIKPLDLSKVIGLLRELELID